MSEAIITVENLSKSYRLQHQARERYTALRDVLTDKVKGLFGNRKSEIGNGNAEEDFWALKDVSFEIKQGEVVGIIGRNGAGKSTLLKILSRITEPTKGRITLRGRVASLLEVGTGFHPELTGRENIFLNGAILGMTRVEVCSKFDEIVAFAEVEKFLDMPVKRYSSGMYVRLAFAVAAHLEPEILIVDEVLAVGDAQFQAKCLGKMRDVASGGRTVLFVSHNIAALRAMCSHGILLEGGQTLATGSCQEALDAYMARQGQPPGATVKDRRLNGATVLRGLNVEPLVVTRGAAAVIEVKLEIEERETLLESALLIYNAGGMRCAILDLRSPNGTHTFQAGDRVVCRVNVAELSLVEGDYDLGLYYRSDRSSGDHLGLARLAIAPAERSATVLPYAAQHRGIMELRHDFRFEVSSI